MADGIIGTVPAPATSRLRRDTGVSGAAGVPTVGGAAAGASSGNAILDQLLAQLASGGTPILQQQQAARTQEVGAVRGQREAFSPEAAQAASAGAVQAALSQALEKLVPSITRAAEGAGTSANSMRALLLQDAAQKAAESAATTGLQAQVQFGQLGINASQLLEALTRPQDPAAQALIQALQVQNQARAIESEAAARAAATDAATLRAGTAGAGATAPFAGTTQTTTTPGTQLIQPTQQTAPTIIGPTGPSLIDQLIATGLRGDDLAALQRETGTTDLTQRFTF